MARKKLVVLTGAGVSRESGLKTFRDGDGLWEGYDIHEVATPEAWERDPLLVQRFYNERRKAVIEAEPNAGHEALVALEQYLEVVIITQNIDDLHERAGSKHVLHLHGEILKAQSARDPTLVYPICGEELSFDEVCEHGLPLRPHVVWFGEPVPMMEPAIAQVESADYFMVVGTSLAVYPAAGLLMYVPQDAPVICIDPVIPPLPSEVKGRVESIEATASIGLPRFLERFHS
jgi:NAD-dependent deacetylase